MCRSQAGLSVGSGVFCNDCFFHACFPHSEPPPPRLSSAFIFGISRQDQRNFRARWKYLAGGEAHVDPCLFDGLSDAVK